MHTRFLALPLLFTICGVLQAQAAWTQLNPTSMPPGRTGAAAASDGAGLLVFGGSDNVSGAQNNDLWRFDGSNWTNLTPTPLPAMWPPARWRHAGAWDLSRGRFVVFGGGLTGSGSSRQNDIWEWDPVTSTWSNPTPATAPSARWWHAMAYDLRNGTVLLFGGQSSAGRLNDTWAWNGTAWTQLSPLNVPPARERAAITNNILTGDILLVGGNPGGGTQLGDTWRWDGTDWQPITTATLPYVNGVRNSAMTYDLARDRYILYGGVNPTFIAAGPGNTLTNTWEYDGNDWIDRGTSPLPHRSFANMAYILTLGKTILFSGFAGASGQYHNDTWEYQTAAFASHVDTGGGCPGTAGTLTLTATSLPWAGETLSVQVTNLPATALPLMVVGLSNTSWSGGSLPWALTAFGAPSCNLLASPDTTLILANVGGTATWDFPIPNNVNLAGLQFYDQCGSLDGSSGSLVIAVSGLGDGVIGVK